MKIEFDARKSARNAIKHGMTLDRFRDLDFSTALVKPDNRNDYGDDRYIVIAYLGERLHVGCFCQRGGGVQSHKPAKGQQAGDWEL